MTLTLDYAGYGTARPRIALYRVALGCALLPLAVGVTTLALFIVTRSEGLMVLGALTVLGGCVLSFVGAASLVAFEWDARRKKCLDDKVLRRMRWWAVCWLLFNYPVAIACAVVGETLAFRITVPAAVLNQGSTQVERFALLTPDRTLIELGPIDPGDSARCSFDASRGGFVDYLMTRNGQASTGVVRDWSDADDSEGDRIRIVITDGEVDTGY